MTAYREAGSPPDERIREPAKSTRWTMQVDTIEPSEAWRQLRPAAKAAHVALFVASAGVALAAVALLGYVVFEVIVLLWPVLLVMAATVALVVAFVGVFCAATYGLSLASLLLLNRGKRRPTEGGLL